MNDKNIFKIVDRLTIPSSDNGLEFINKDRLKEIKKILKNSTYKQIAKGNLFRLYGKRRLDRLSNDLVLISTHVDCLQEYKYFYEDARFIHGIFDNSSTNAAIICLMLEDVLPDNVVIGFTGAEEINSGGAKELARYLSDNGKILRCIVLDVTSFGWSVNADFTIENNFWRDSLGHVWGRNIIDLANSSNYEWRFISSKVDEKKGYLDKSLLEEFIDKNHIEVGSADYDYASGPNESWDYDKMEINCFTLGLPCSAKTPEEMHKNNGFDIRKTAFINYMKFLKRILNIERL